MYPEQVKALSRYTDRVMEQVIKTDPQKARDQLIGITRTREDDAHCISLQSGDTGLYNNYLGLGSLTLFDFDSSSPVALFIRNNLGIQTKKILQIHIHLDQKTEDSVRKFLSYPDPIRPVISKIELATVYIFDDLGNIAKLASIPRVLEDSRPEINIFNISSRKPHSWRHSQFSDEIGELGLIGHCLNTIEERVTQVNTS